MITFLWAQSKNGIIGIGNQLPWKIKSEMEHFKKYTMNKAVLMGRNTWDGLYVKPLPNRKNIVITSRPIETFENTEVTSNLNEAIKPYQNSKEELVVIGGKKIFESLIGQADKLVISYIKQEFYGDVSAPIWNHGDFKLILQEQHDYFDVFTYQRISIKNKYEGTKKAI